MVNFEPRVGLDGDEWQSPEDLAWADEVTNVSVYSPEEMDSASTSATKLSRQGLSSPNSPYKQPTAASSAQKSSIKPTQRFLDFLATEEIEPSEVPQWIDYVVLDLHLGNKVLLESHDFWKFVRELYAHFHLPQNARTFLMALVATLRASSMELSSFQLAKKIGSDARTIKAATVCLDEVRKWWLSVVIFTS